MGDSKVKNVTSIPVDSLVSQYMAMCDWASSPSKWRISRGEGLPEDPASVGCSLLPLPEDEATTARAQAAEALTQACEANASAVSTKAQAQLPTVEVHGRELRRGGVHHVDVQGLGLVDVPC